MTELVSFQIAKLLKEKGYNTPKNKMYCRHIPLLKNHHETKLYDGNKGECSPDPCDWNSVKSMVKSTSYYSAPTIAEVVMWLYEKHDLWILPLPKITGYFAYKIVDVQLNPEKTIERPPYKDVSSNDYNSPTEAYEAAIEYVLTNLI